MLPTYLMGIEHHLVSSECYTKWAQLRVLPSGFKELTSRFGVLPSGSGLPS